MANKKITDLIDSGQPIDDNTVLETAEQTAPSTFLSFKASFAKIKVWLNTFIPTATQTAIDTKLNKSGSNADQDVDLGAFGLNTKHVKVNGTGGSGHIGLKHQSGSITASASESSIGANSSGSPVWKNDGNAIQSIMLENTAITGATKTKITYDTKGLVTVGADATQDDIGDGTTYKQYSASEKTKLSKYPSTATNGKMLQGDGTNYVEVDAPSGGSFTASSQAQAESAATNTAVNTPTTLDTTTGIVPQTLFYFKEKLKLLFRQLFSADTVNTTGSTTIDFALDGKCNITQTGNITLTGTSTASYTEKTYVIKGSRNIAHTFTIDATWKAANNTLPSSMYDNIIRVYSVNSEVFFCVNVFDSLMSSTFDFSEGMILYPELTKIRVYATGTLDQTVVPSTSWFTATGKTVTAVSIYYNYIDITVNTAYLISDTPTVGYTSGAGRLVDEFGNLLTSFSEVVAVEILVSDAFNRANSTTTLGNADTGQTWQYVSPAVFGINSNRMYCSSAVDALPATSHITYINTGEADHSVTFDKIFPASTNQTITRYLLRYTDINNHYRCGFVRAQSSTTVTCLIQSVKAGVTSAVLATITGFSTVSNGSEQTRTYTCRIKGNTIYVYENATLLGSYTDNATDKLISGNNAGVLFLANLNNSSVQDRLDNLYITKS